MTVATDMLAKYLEAEAAVLAGKEISFGDPPRRLRMEDLNMIQAGRKEWEQRVNSEAAGAAGARTFGGRPFSVARFGSE
jgi:hypothetical protein